MRLKISEISEHSFDTDHFHFAGESQVWVEQRIMMWSNEESLWKTRVCAPISVKHVKTIRCFLDANAPLKFFNELTI